MEKEKKLKIRSLLHLRSAAGSIPVKMFFSEFSCTGAVDPFSVSCDESQFFMASFSFENAEFNEKALPVLIYVASFSVRKMKPNCIANVVCCY